MHIYRPMPASNLSKDATQDIRKALHYTSQNDVHGLFEETGLLTNDIKK